MSKQWDNILMEAGAGLVGGLRSMTMPTFLLRRLLIGKRKSTLARWGRPLGLLALGEMTADKTSFVPDRTRPVSLVGRAVIAGVCGAVIANHQKSSPVKGAIVSSAVAVGSTLLSYRLRKKVCELTDLPDPVVGFAEDLIVVSLANKVTEKLD